MQQADLYQWLLENGGPVIRYRTATELLSPVKSLDIPRLTDELRQTPLVQTWLGNLVPPRLLLNYPANTPPVLASGIMEVHGSKTNNLENVLGKLTDFGVKRGIPELDQRTLPYRKWLEKIVERPKINVFDSFSMGMVADFLARASYVQEPVIGIILRKRLDTVYDFVRKGDYDIHVPNKYIRKLPLIKLEVVRGGICRLPLIYDIIGWGAYLPEYGTEEDCTKADTVINYILNEKYQQFPWGYGIMGDGTGRTWSLGWSVHLPGFTDSLSPTLSSTLRVQMMNLLINFRAARRHPWLMESLNHLEEFRTEKGTYLFPREYLQEKHQGYWVNGYRMRLGDKLEVESTFWIMKVRKMISE